MNKYERSPQHAIDLHGYTTREAEGVLLDLIKSRPYKHVRIITGKATFRETGPVLRTFVQNFLRKYNIEFHTAKISDGGDGALEVYFD